MVDGPWLGDACSLVDAFRRRERTPLEELDATLAAIERSGLNATAHLDVDAAREAAAAADVTRPFGGVPVGIKELTAVAGWPATEASVPLRAEVAAHTATSVTRLVRDGGAVAFGQTTASEFGGVNLTRTQLHGITRNPWDLERTPGGSSGGAAAAVAGGLCTIATGGDGGGSIRIPAGFTGLVGLKHTYGRIPKGPGMVVGSLTAVSGCLARSVRDAARYLDVCNGFDPRDPYSLPRVDGWEAGLGRLLDALAGRRVAIVPNLARAVVHPEVGALVEEHGALLAKDAGLERVDVEVDIPELSYEWALAGLAEIVLDLGDRWPECEAQLTPQIAFGLKIAHEVYDIGARARIEEQRVRMNEGMAALFEQADVVIAATNPDVAFAAAGPLPDEVDGQKVPLGNNGALTIPSNIYGNPAIQIPIGESRRDGLPIGMQVLAPHHREDWLLDLALVVERERPWPLVAPGAPR